MTKWCTESDRCSAKCPATNGSASPMRARFWRTCTRTPARSCCSWGRKSASTKSGTTLRAFPGSFSSSITTASCRAFARELNHFYCQNPALYEVDFHYSGFEWIDFHDVENSVIAFLRKAADPNDFLLFCCNFTPMVRHGYRFGVPAAGIYDEVFNTDADCFGGGNVRNDGGIVLPAGRVPRPSQQHCSDAASPRRGRLPAAAIEFVFWHERNLISHELQSF